MGARHEHSPPQTILRSNCFIGSQSFSFQSPFSTSFGGQSSVSKDRWPICTLWNRFSVPLTVEKAPKTASKLDAQGRSKPQRRTKITTTSTLTGRTQAKTTFSTSVAVFSITGAHHHTHPALRFFSSAIYSYQGNLATCFTCLHQSKTSQKGPCGVRTMAFKHACSLA